MNNTDKVHCHAQALRPANRQIVKDRFNRKWSRSDGPPPRIENIFHVDEAEFRASHRGQRWNAYRLRRHGSWSFGFHGTTRYCHVGCELGERNGRLLVCQNDACGIYGIINNSFKVSRSGEISCLFLSVIANLAEVVDCLERGFIRHILHTVSSNLSISKGTNKRQKQTCFLKLAPLGVVSKRCCCVNMSLDVFSAFVLGTRSELDLAEATTV